MSWTRAGWAAVALLTFAVAAASHRLSIYLSSFALSLYVTCIVWAWFDYFSSRDHTEMAYKNRFIRIEFPELGDDIWVDIINPLTAPMEMLTSTIPVGESDDADSARRNSDASYDIAAKLIVRWNVYDAYDMSDDPQPMELPATAEKLKRVPAIVMRRLSQEMGKAMETMNGNTSTES